MKDKRFTAGIVLSGAWLIAAAWIFSTNAHPDKLNEWGDFLAGFSAPLAFLWLVLGYLQQGEELKNNTEALRLQAQELRHSTDALKLQAEELKNSVEQQSQLVAVSRDQMALEMRTLEEERHRRKLHALPKFVARHGGHHQDLRTHFHLLEIVNVGNQATSVTISVGPVGDINSQRFEVFGKDHKYTAPVRYVTDADYFAKFEFFDAEGNYGEAMIEFSITTSTLTAKPIQMLQEQYRSAPTV